MLIEHSISVMPVVIMLSVNNAECQISYIVSLSVIILSTVMLIVIALNV